MKNLFAWLEHMFATHPAADQAAADIIGDLETRLHGHPLAIYLMDIVKNDLAKAAANAPKPAATPAAPAP